MDQIVSKEIPTCKISHNICLDIIQAEKKDDPNENEGKNEEDGFSHIYMHMSDDEFRSSSNLEIPTSENRIGYSAIFLYWAPTNGPNITELHLTNDSLHIPDLKVNSDSYFLPVLKMFTTHLESSSQCEYRSSKHSKTIAINFSRILEVLQAPQLESFEFQDDFKEKRSMFLGKRKISCWERPLANFIKNHCVSLKRLSVVAWKSSVPPEIQLEKGHPFPELEELSIGFWGHETHDFLSPENNFWVALLKSQSTQLKKLNWCVSCSMSWENVIVPVITKNFSTLESIQMLLPIIASDTEEGRLLLTRESNFIFSIDCGVFSNVTQLKILHLAWQYCFLHNLHSLPNSLQDIRFLSIPVRSCELIKLKNLPELKKLDLVVPKFCRCSQNAIVDITRKEEYGVTHSVLKQLLTSESLTTITTNLFPDAFDRISGHDLANQSKKYAEEIASWWFLLRNWFQDKRPSKKTGETHIVILENS